VLGALLVAASAPLFFLGKRDEYSTCAVCGRHLSERSVLGLLLSRSESPGECESLIRELRPDHEVHRWEVSSTAWWNRLGCGPRVSPGFLVHAIDRHGPQHELLDLLDEYLDLAEAGELDRERLAVFWERLDRLEEGF